MLFPKKILAGILAMSLLFIAPSEAKPYSKAAARAGNTKTNSFAKFGDGPKAAEAAVMTKEMIFESKTKTMYASTGLSIEELPYAAFQAGLKGFYRLKSEGKISKNILAVANFDKSSKQERLFVIDLNTNKVLHKSLVAHGRNSGLEFATDFSNREGSLQTSLGFFVTAETYNGDFGFALRLDGQERGINDKARERGIVIHGASYVNRQLAKYASYIGRSWGCPSLPYENHKDVINSIKDGACFFIYHSDKNYQRKSKLANLDVNRLFEGEVF